VVANALQERYAEMLLDRIRRENHPSGTHMDMLESVASPQVLAEYVLHLMEKIEADEYPSIPMMRRAQRIMAELG
jgi:hypothetical protein